jgi:glyoxylase-like metal-dependent hydrolase (beta-lactamase superfamily II)
VILTHLHTDHAGGLLVDGRLQYPRAEVIVHADEIAYWQGRDAVRDEILHACAPNLKTVTDGENLGHGIRAWALPGHTPGHMGLRIGDALALIGDVIHSEALQFPEPETRNANDVTRADAEATRRTCLDTIVDNDLVWTGSHMLGPDKFARLARQGAGYVRVTR